MGKVIEFPQLFDNNLESTVRQVLGRLVFNQAAIDWIWSDIEPRLAPVNWIGSFDVTVRDVATLPIVENAIRATCDEVAKIMNQRLSQALGVVLALELDLYAAKFGSSP